MDAEAMSLTESKLKDLKDKKFVALFDNNKDEWTEITGNAYASARDHICEGRPPRQDDVLKMLMPILEPNERLRKHQEENRARFKHYREAFGEYLIDEYFRSIEVEKDAEAAKGDAFHAPTFKQLD
jgi:hypothetical protein